jgi:hypothetical protein
VPGRRTPDASSGNLERIFATETQIALQLLAEVFGAPGLKFPSAFTSTDTSRNCHSYFYTFFLKKNIIQTNIIWKPSYSKIPAYYTLLSYIGRLINKTNSLLLVLL